MWLDACQVSFDFIKFFYKKTVSRQSTKNPTIFVHSGLNPSIQGCFLLNTAFYFLVKDYLIWIKLIREEKSFKSNWDSKVWFFIWWLNWTALRIGVTIIAAVSGLVPGVQQHVPLHPVDLGVLAPDREAFFVDGRTQTFTLQGGLPAV